jgi:hypothetical protein
MWVWSCWVAWEQGSSALISNKFWTKVQTKFSLVHIPTTGWCTTVFRKFQELVYYTEISNLTPVHRKFPSEEFPWTVRHWCKCLWSFWKHCWKLFFNTSVSALVTFAMTFSVLMNRPFRTLSSCKNSVYVNNINILMSHGKSPARVICVSWSGINTSGNTCSFLCECFQLMILLLLISPEYLNTKDLSVPPHRSLTLTWPPQNVYATVFSVLLPYHVLQAFVICLMEVYQITKCTFERCYSRYFKMRGTNL